MKRVSHCTEGGKKEWEESQKGPSLFFLKVKNKGEGERLSGSQYSVTETLQ